MAENIERVLIFLMATFSVSVIICTTAYATLVFWKIRGKRSDNQN